jgi:phosphatidate cytidylyltransferase
MSGHSGGETGAGPAVAPAAGRELVTRFFSGLVLAAVAAGLLYAGPLPFAVLVGGVGLAASYEWSRIVRGGDIDAPLIIHMSTVGLTTVLSALGFAALALAVVAAGAILVGLLTVGRRPLLSAEGVLYAGLPTVALLWLREDVPHGLPAVLFIFIAVVATDVAAYACGRLIGGPKLAPAISPNKTWAGFLGGITAAGVAAYAFAHTIGSPPPKLAAFGLVLGILAQIGDLTESALKRSFGVKDSGAIIPGHGGVLDRVDGLIFAAVAAGIFALAVDPQAPASALLFNR